MDFLSKQDENLLSDLDEDFITQLTGEQALVKTEIDNLRSRVVGLKEELESIWRSETKAAYELTSVFIHRGSSPSWGHYFFYSRNLPDHPDSWFKYNDSDVSEVSKDEVLADTTGSTANPYLVSRSVQVRSMPLIEMIHVACICAQRIGCNPDSQSL